MEPLHLSDYVKSLDGEPKKRYMAKISLIGDVDPYNIEKRLWCATDDSLWPDTCYADVFNYLVCSESPYTKEDLKAYKGLQAYNQFVCGWVRDVAVIAKGELRVVTSRVMHSQRMNDTPLQPWLIVQKDGEVRAAHCTCMAGLGEACTHIAATLFYLEAKVKLINAKTVTQDKAYWMLPGGVKKVAYMPIREIDFTSAKSKRKRLEETLSNEATTTVSPVIQSPGPTRAGVKPQPPTDNQLMNLYTALSNSNSKPSILSIIPGFSHPYIPKSTSPSFPKPLTSALYREELVGLKLEDLLDQCDEEFQNISVSPDEVITVEKATREQSKSNLWFAMRAGRVTASKLKAVCVSNPHKPAQSLLKAICDPKTCAFTSPATQWGCEQEKYARDMYTEKLKDSHLNFCVAESGFLLHPDYPYMGASPDGLVNCDCCGEGCVEIKCPYSCREKLLKDSLTADFCLSEVDGDLRLKNTHQYYFQCQCQIFIGGKDYCDFVVYTKHDIHVERIGPDYQFWDTTVPKVKEFYKKAIMPELLCKFYSRLRVDRPVLTNITNNQKVTADPELYCYCREKEHGRMIGCDNMNCPLEWFHFKCVKMTNAPKGAWYCPDCRKLPQFQNIRK